jgi:hypothetical protein
MVEPAGTGWPAALTMVIVACAGRASAARPIAAAHEMTARILKLSLEVFQACHASFMVRTRLSRGRRNGRDQAARMEKSSHLAAPRG